MRVICNPPPAYGHTHTQLEACTSYEERSKIRSALRNLKKKRGEAVGRHTRKGTSGYNRFAASSTLKSAPIPKSYIKSGETEAVKSVR